MNILHHVTKEQLLEVVSEKLTHLIDKARNGELSIARGSRRGLFPNPRQQFRSPSMSPQQFGFPRSNSFPQPRDYFYPYNQGNSFSIEQWQQQQQPFNPYQQMPNQGYGGLSDNLNTIMGHVGTITNGINMVRQFGSILSLFRL